MLKRIFSYFYKKLKTPDSTNSNIGIDLSLVKRDDVFKILRKKWHEVPSGYERIDSQLLLGYTDKQLLKFFKNAKKTNPQLRDWYYSIYKPELKGKRLLDIGSGLGLDSIELAQSGVQVTCLDIVESNLMIIKRLIQLLDVKNIDVFYMNDIHSIKNLPNNFDVIWANGSLHHAPFEVARAEVLEFVKHLKPNGRWIELCYPKSRWEKEGYVPFTQWGERTDGVGTPWAEWYDLPKLLSRFEPLQWEVIRNLEFHNNDFIWFDLKLK